MRFPLIAGLLVPTLAFAQGPVAGKPAGGKPVGVVDGAFGIDFTTQYFFRGFQQENQGIIAQPWIELGWGLFEDTGSLRDIDLTVGSWNSLHDGPAGGAGGIWYESQFFIDLDADIDRWNLRTRYTAYTSPNGQALFGNIEELGFSAGFDDKGLWLEDIASGLQPRATVALELDGQRDLGNDRGIFAAVGVTPSFPLGDSTGMVLTLEVPVQVGLSLTDYYERQGTGGVDELFGFFQVGGVLKAPIDWLPSRAGPWLMEVGLHWMVLGDNLEERNNGDSSELILNFGIETRW